MTRGFSPRLRSLQTKWLLGTLFVIALIMAGMMAVIEELQRGAIMNEVQRRGEVLARSLAATSTGPLLLYNFTALEQNAVQIAREADVVYAIVLDAEGKVVAHSRRPDLVGFELKGPVHEAAAGTRDLLVQESVQRRNGEALYDVAVPVEVEGQKWGTARVGLSRQRMDAQIRRTRWELAGLALATLLIGALGAAFVARRVARPVRQLAAGAEAIARGELDQRIEPTGPDEIAQLALTFNHMASELRHHQSQLESANAELRCRFAEVAELKNYTDSILGSVTSGIVTLDLDGRVATLNPAAEMLSGLFALEVTGRYCLEVFAHTAEVGELLMETLDRRTGVATVSLTLRRPNGTTLPVEMSTAPLRGREGKDLGVVGVFRDVTVLRELEEQVRRSDCLAAVGTLAAGLAHEIKNPLTSLRTFTRFMPRKFDDERFRERFQRVVPHELERINSIVEQLLELARPARLAFQPARLAELLDRTLDLYANQIEAKDIQVRREYARDCGPIQADPEYLYQAFVNLVANALDAMESGGRLTLRVGWNPNGAGPGPLRPGVPGRYVKVEIEDTGAGIEWSQADKVFNPFFTTKASGTGLGLALTHKIVEDHHGRITFRSVPGQGTTFRVLLPETASTGRPSERALDG
jgi:two-component system sensor histidine kinase AtoS